MSLLTRIKTIQPIIIVMLIAIFLRVWAVSLLPQDYDEPVYLQDAFDYADAYKSDGLSNVIDYSGNPEHPALVKLLYATAVLSLGDAATWTNAFFASRSISALFGILAVLFVAIAVDPLAAGLLAVHTLAVKYTSQVYLEAVPHAMTIGSVLALLKMKNEKPDRWFFLSAIALGIAAASKYSYLPVVLIVLGYIAIFEKKLNLKSFLIYLVISLLAFFVLDVYLWHSPISRLLGSLSFHVQYSQGQHVAEVGYPWFQPFIWIFTSPAANWHPNVFFYFGFDGLISLLAVGGIKNEWQHRRWLVVWLSFGIFFLLLWPTKWPQYALTVTPALCIMGAQSLRRLLGWIRNQESYWGYLKEMFPKPGKWLWITIGGFLFFIAAIYLSAAIKLAIGRVGWSNITEENSFLPDNAVYALLPLDDNQMLIGTNHGAALWVPANQSDTDPSWLIFNSTTSGLINDTVLSLARDQQGHIWFGTADGISYFDENTKTNWRSFDQQELGSEYTHILSLAAADAGDIYAGTLNGAIMFNGGDWIHIAPTSRQAVFSVALSPDDSELWVGMASGVGKLSILDESWSFFPTEAPVKYILIDTQNTLWAATSGAGIAKLEDASWTYYRTSNSGMPFNTVNCLIETGEHVIWVGTSHPTSSLGALARLDDGTWQTYSSSNSGTSAAEITTIAIRSDEIWMGTRTKGIDIYQLGRNK
jgi:sugar lactone lactonase YvrE